MGVYIKGMEMPTDNTILLRIFPVSENGECYVQQIDVDDDILAELWAVPVPPHGRLIDADALISRIYDAAKQQPEIADLYEDEADDMIAWLKTTPTIIEAEVEE